jgi:predicted alpha/beta superfamily hydrolase
MRALAIALTALLFLSAPALAQTPAAPAANDAPEPPPRLRQRDFTEATLNSREGLEYRILMSAPRGPAPEGGFPVFYVLDGDAFFNTAVEIARMREWGRLTPSIVVGIAYPSRGFYDGPRRDYDFTPPGSSDPDFDPVELGGADKFVTFLTDVVKPWVASQHQVDAGREVLFGHSMGGLFVLHAMFTAPRSFDVYLAASPTMQFSNLLPLREARAFERHPDRGLVRALISVGELESSPPPQQVDDYRRYFAAHPEVRDGLSVEEALQQLFPPDQSGFNKARETRRMAQRLARSGADVSFELFEGDEHLPAGVTALLRGVPFALRPALSSR